MSDSGCNSRKKNVRRQNRQPSLEVLHRDSGVGNGTQPSAILYTTDYIPCKQFLITELHSRPQFHLPPLGSLASGRRWWHLVAKVGTSKSGGKQWQATPKNLPRLQRTRAIPVVWLISGLFPNRPKGWKPVKKCNLLWLN